MPLAPVASPMTSATTTPVDPAVVRSYGRCCLNPKFFDRFYENFAKQSHIIGQMFAKTDMAKQKQLLRSGIAFLFQFAQGSQYAAQRVGDLGASHSRTRHNINPDMYPLWTEALMMTVQEFDQQFTPELRAKWIAALRQGIERMISMY